MTQVQRRTLGKSDLHVSPLGLGCWQFSEGQGLVGRFWPALGPAVIDEIVNTSLQGGINWFDTAEIYGRGASERALSSTLSRMGVKPSEVVIATKWWPVLRRASSIQKTIDDRIRALSPYAIDLYQVHQPYSWSSIAQQMEAMAALVESHQVRYVGVSNFSARQMELAYTALERRGITLVSNQVKYNLLHRKIESNDTLRLAKELGVSIIAYSPLEQGLLTGKFHGDPELLKRVSGPRKYSSGFSRRGLERTRPLIQSMQSIAEKHGATPAQVALNWLMHHHGDTVVAIPGASRSAQASQNAGALSFVMSSEDSALLSELSWQVLGRS